MKYIDAVQLIERLEEMKQAEYENCGGVNSKTGALQEVQELIASLQQEQLPGIEEHGVPGKDFIPVEWVDACEKYGKWKIVQQEQPKVNLENYISNKLRELGADLINHKPYSFNRGLNVGKTNAYNDILNRLNGRKKE